MFAGSEFLDIFGPLDARKFLETRAGLLAGHLLVVDDAQVLSRQPDRLSGRDETPSRTHGI